MTSPELLKRILRLFPDFREFSDEEINASGKEAASLTCFEVLISFSRYYSLDCESWGPVALDDISTVLEDRMMSAHSESATGARSFIATIVGKMAGDCLSDYLGPKGSKCYDTHMAPPAKKIKNTELISKFSKILLGKRP